MHAKVPGKFLTNFQPKVSGCVPFYECWNCQFCQRIERYAENCFADVSRSINISSVGKFSSSFGNGDRRFVECSKSCRNNEQKAYSNEYRSRTCGKLSDGIFSYCCQSLWTSSFYYPCFGRLNFWCRIDFKKS